MKNYKCGFFLKNFARSFSEKLVRVIFDKILKENSWITGDGYFQVFFKSDFSEVPNIGHEEG